MNALYHILYAASTGVVRRGHFRALRFGRGKHAVYVRVDFEDSPPDIELIDQSELEALCAYLSRITQ